MHIGECSRCSLFSCPFSTLFPVLLFLVSEKASRFQMAFELANKNFKSDGYAQHYINAE